jgi:hypothetical protein
MFCSSFASSAGFSPKSACPASFPAVDLSNGEHSSPGAVTVFDGFRPCPSPLMSTALSLALVTCFCDAPPIISVINLLKAVVFSCTPQEAAHVFDGSNDLDALSGWLPAPKWLVTSLCEDLGFHFPISTVCVP